MEQLSKDNEHLLHSYVKPSEEESMIIPRSNESSAKSTRLNDSQFSIPREGLSVIDEDQEERE
jgi:hypothetical protein